MRIQLALIAFGTLITTAAAAGPPGKLLAQILNGKALTARQTLVPMLATGPNDPSANVLMGMALSVEGKHNDAMIYYRAGEAAPMYWDQCVSYHAESLRYSGQPGQAAALRDLQLLAPDLDAEGLIWLEKADDHRAAGELDQAWEAASQALALRPLGIKAHAVLADIAMDAGQLELAEGHLFLAEKRIEGAAPPRLYLTQARLYLAQGEHARALELVKKAREQRRWLVEGVYLHTMVLLAMGDVSGASSVLNKPKLNPKQSPPVLLARVHLLIAQGKIKQAQQAWHVLQELAPGTVMFPEYVPGLSPTPELPK